MLMLVYAFRSFARVRVRHPHIVLNPTLCPNNVLSCLVFPKIFISIKEKSQIISRELPSSKNFFHNLRSNQFI